MTNVRCPGWACVALLVLWLLAVPGPSYGQQMICQQTVPDSCPPEYFCDSNSVCVPLKETSNNTTTYIILGCVLGGVVIIAAVIIILYCGRWSWVTRLKQQFIRRPAPRPRPVAYQQPPRQSWARSIRKRIKLKFGGVRRNPYTSSANPAPTGASPQTFTASPQTFTASPQTFTASPQTFTASPQTFTASPQTLTVNSQTLTASPPTLTVTPAPVSQDVRSEQTIETRYIVGQDNADGSQFGGGSDTTPYVATVELSGADRQAVPQQTTYNAGQVVQPQQTTYNAGQVVQPQQTTYNAGQVVQLGQRYLSGSRHSLNSLDAYQEVQVACQPPAQAFYAPPSPQMPRTQINIQAPIPIQPAQQHIIVQEPEPVAGPVVLEPANPPVVVPHTHEVYPSLYPSLGHGHTHAPSAPLPTYTEVPRKY